MRRAAALCLVVGLPALNGQLSVDDPWPMHGQNVRLTGQSTATADTAGASTGKAGELNWRVQMQDCDDRRRALGSDSRNSSSSDDDDGCGSNMALVSSSVAVSSDGTMFIGTYDGHMHAISTSDGTYSWKEKFTDCSFQYSAVSIDQDGLLVVGCSAGLLAVHQSSGKKAWFYALDDAVTASPTIDPEGGVIYAPCTDGNVYAFHKVGVSRHHRHGRCRGGVVWSSGRGGGASMMATPVSFWQRIYRRPSSSFVVVRRRSPRALVRRRWRFVARERGSGTVSPTATPSLIVTRDGART